MDIFLLDTSGHLVDPYGGPDTLRAADPPADVAGVAGVPAPPIYAPAARAEVKRILEWLNAHGDKPRLFAWLPPVAEGQTDHFSDLVCEVAIAGQAFAICIVELARLSPDLLERLYIRGLRRIFIRDDLDVSTADAIARVKSARQRLEDMRKEPDGRIRPMLPHEWYGLSLWTVPSGAPENYHRTRAWYGAGITWEMVSETPMTIGAHETDFVDATETPEAYREALTCRFYENTIVIDSDLKVLACPRYAGSEGSLAGMLYRYVPEELMLNKGRRAGTIGCTELCATCGLGARFRWDKSRPAVVDDYMQIGRREGALAYVPGVPPQLEGRHIDLAAVSADQQAAELAAFEQSLDAWAADMEGLDEAPAQK